MEKNCFNKEGIYFVALGGSEEVGFNMYAYAVDGEIILVDCGYGFLNNDFPGIELGLADPSFLEDYKDDVKAIFITHAHEDHFGAIAHVLPRFDCPVYSNAFALEHIKSRLREYKLTENASLNVVEDGETISLNNLSVQFIGMTHSTAQSCGLAIRTKYGNVFHAPDWRLDDGSCELYSTNYSALEAISKDGVDLYVGDSTNMRSVKEEPSEMEIRESLFSLIPNYKNTLVATCFASNIFRLESLILAAVKAGRTPVISGMSLTNNIKFAQACGMLADLPPIVEARNSADIPLDKVLYICAGSQGNYRSALQRIANGENKNLILGKGDAIIFSSKIIPGNEQKIETLQEKLKDAGVDVITCEDYLVHTSGHAGQDEIKKMYELLKPRIVLPVHGDKRNIREQKRFALSNGIKEVITVRNGEVLLINQDKHIIVGEVPTDILGVDRNCLTSLSSQLIQNRKRIAFNCSLFISVMFDKDWKMLDLQISSIDILQEQDFKILSEKTFEHINKHIDEDVVKWNHNKNLITENLRAKIRKYIFKATDIKPVTIMHIYHKDV